MSEETPAFQDPFQDLLNHLDSKEMNYGHDKEEKRAWFWMRSGNFNLHYRLQVSQDDTVFQIYIVSPIYVDEKFRSLASEYFHRATYGLTIGAFEFDFKDGESRYHISQIIEGKKLEEETINRLVYSGFNTSKRYLDGLMKIIYAGETPTDAIYLAELDIHADLVEETPAATEESKAPEQPKKKASKAKKSRKPKLSPPPTSETQRDLTLPMDGEAAPQDPQHHSQGDAPRNSEQENHD